MRLSEVKGVTLAAVGLGLIGLTFVMMLSLGEVDATTIELVRIILMELGLPLSGPPADPLITSVLMEIRLPRMLLGLLVGGALGVSGALMQGVFRNPLADPGLIGVSSGGALAASGFIVLCSGTGLGMTWLGQVGTPFFAFGGALLATYLVWQLGTVGGRVLVSRLLLAGIAVNALVGASIGCLTMVATNTELRDLVYWSLGSLNGATWGTVAVCLFALSPAVIFGPRLARSLDAWLLGEAEAHHLGVDVKSLKRQVIGITALAVGTAVAVSGIIGFVGLVIPHAVRLVLGPGHRRLLLGSGLLGAWFLMCADVLARLVVAPVEVPIGVVTALVGAPLFISLLRQSDGLGQGE